MFEFKKDDLLFSVLNESEYFIVLETKTLDYNNLKQDVYVLRDIHTNEILTIGKINVENQSMLLKEFYQQQFNFYENELKVGDKLKDNNINYFVENDHENYEVISIDNNTVTFKAVNKYNNEIENITIDINRDMFFAKK